MPAPPSGRRDLLLKAKCRALVRSRWGEVVDGATEANLPGGAAIAAGRRAWVLAEDEPERVLGAALAWSGRHGAAAPDGELHVLASGGAGTLARRAGGFDRGVDVWRIDGTSLERADPEALVPEPALDPRAEAWRPVIERAGAEAIVEHGVLRAEVRGLEVARVEVDGDGAHLAVGVGKHDRDAHREVRGRDHGFDELFEVVRIVAEHRVAGGEGHAAFHLSPERWLRSVVIRRPELVGASSLVPVSPPVARADLRRAAGAPAAGADLAGGPMVVVCSVGSDVDLVPAAVDVWLADGREPRLVVCVPEGDDHRITRDLVGWLRTPATIVTVGRDWRETPRP